MRSSWTIGIALAALALAPSAGAADDGVPVPNPQAPEASFAAAGKTGRSFVARGADRARMVAFEAILITATRDAEVALDAAPGESEQPPAVGLVRGGFHAVAGSRAVELRLGDTALRATRAAVTAVRLGDKWVVQVQPESDEGYAEVIPPAPPPPAEPAPDEGAEADAEPAPDPPAPPAPIRLTPGKRHTVSGGQPRTADRSESQVLAKTVDRLISGEGDQLLPVEDARAAKLEPRAVEDPSDFVVLGAGADAALGDLELEDIEVDVGCVEICVD